MKGRYAIIVGKEELDGGKLSLRDMDSGSQELATFDQIVKRFKNV